MLIERDSLTLLLLLFFLDLALLIAENPVHIGLDREQFAHLVSCFTVVGIGCFLLRQQLCIFLLQTLDGGQFFQPQLIKRFFRGAVQQDVGLMLGQIFLGVAGGFVGRKDLPRFGIVDDLLLEYGNLSHTLPRRSTRRRREHP